MNRIVVLTVLVLIASAAPALAQEAKSSIDTSASTTVLPAPDDAKVPAAAVNSPRLFSKAAIEKAVAKSAPAVPQTKKSFWKTPWPYVIIGAVAVIVAIALGGSSSSNGIY